MYKIIPLKITALTLSIYTTQYLGVAFIMAAAVAILRQDGASLDQLALLNLVALPLAFKIFYAPFIDQYRLFFKGQYRSWLLIAQLVMAITLWHIGTMNYQTQLLPIIIILLIYALAVALQDVAIDGLACKIFAHEERQYANSLQFAGNLLGNIIGGGVLLITYPWLGWQGSLWLLAGLTSISWVQLWFYQEPEAHKRNQTHGFCALLRDCKNFIQQNKRWFLFLLIFPLAASGAFAMLNPMLVDAGWELGEIGWASKIYGSIIGVFSALSASIYIKKWGRQGTLSILTMALAVALVFFMPLARGFTQTLWVYLALSAYFLVFPALLTTFGTMMMDKASHSDHRATLFTLQFSILTLMGFVYAGVCMALAKWLGYDMVVVIGIVAAIGCGYLSRLKM